MSEILCGAHAQSKIRVSGYYAGWMQGWYDNGRLSSSEVDYNSLDYIIHFGLVPNSDGTIDYSTNSILQTNSDPLISDAHAKGRKVIICIGGWGTDIFFRGATSQINIISFVNRIVSFMEIRGYDGIDVDWEVLEESDSVQYVNFIKLLRTSLNLLGPDKLLTIAVGWQPGIIASIQQYIDQINLMTYDLSGAWPGWLSWYNSPVYSGGNTFPSTGRPVPSVDNMISQFVAAGVLKSKISIGIDFYGYIWKGGVSRPLQTWSSPPLVEPNIPYYQIMDNYFRPELYHWDPNAEACYLQVDSSCSDEDMFITYDDARSCKAKVEYAIKNGLAGVFIWEIGAGVSSDNQQHLLNEIKAVVSGTKLTPAVPALFSPPDNDDGSSLPLVLSWYPSDDAVSYHIQVSKDQNFNSIVIDSTTSNVLSITVNNLNPVQKYYWHVKASNDTDTSGFTQPFEFTTSGPALPVPGLIMPKDNGVVSSPEVRFAWQHSPNAASYHFQLAASSDFCNKIIDTFIEADTNYYTTLDLQYNVQYFWRVKAIPKDGDFTESLFSPVSSFMDSSSNGNPGGNIPTEFKLNNYPNPFNGSTNIQFYAPIKCYVKLFITDVAGKYVETLFNNNVNPGTYTVPFSGNRLASGVYFYTIMVVYSKTKYYAHFSKSGKMILLK